MSDSISALPTSDLPRFRASQQQILSYTGGRMAIAAVPGAGKTFTLAHLAAQLVSRLTSKSLLNQQEVIVVTFSNSAVNTIKARIADILQRQRGLLPYVGYRVRTLHGLAHDLVRERPSLVGLAEDFKIIDERVSAAILKESVDAWLRAQGDDLLAPHLNPEQRDDESSLNQIKRRELPALALSVASTLIRKAKDQLLTPALLAEKLSAARQRTRGQQFPLVQFGLDIYDAYARSLSYRGAVDFDDLVRLALHALRTDAAFLTRKREQWAYILEDEAQDSSALQEQMLGLLSNQRNWVRVGDPNQAINTTFTTANPQFLRTFMQQADVTAYPLAEAGRSAAPIIALANALVDWTAEEHPVAALRDAFYPQQIVPVEADDAQPNPPTDQAKVYLHYRSGESITPEKEIQIVVQSLQQWLATKPPFTVAVLVPDNQRGFKVAEALQANNIAYEELLRSTSATRDAAEALRAVLIYLATPTDSNKLSALYQQWWQTHLGTSSAPSAWLEAGALALKLTPAVEAFLFPELLASPFERLKLKTTEAALIDDLEAFRRVVVRWIEATILTVDQLILTIGQDLFAAPTDIALTYKIAGLLRDTARENPDWRLPQFADELRAISQNERRFIGFDDAETGFKPRPGVVTIATMHAAKGLEWDRVYLLAVNNYSFPSAQPFDRYYGEKWFLRPGIDLEAEASAQLQAVVNGGTYHEGDASAQSRVDIAAEKLRLLYVGITRARRELMMTWNTGKGKTVSRPALPLVALAEYLSPPP